MSKLKRELHEAQQDRNQLQVLLAAVVTKAGGEILVSKAMASGCIDATLEGRLHVNVTMTDEGVCIRAIRAQKDDMQ